MEPSITRKEPWTCSRCTASNQWYTNFCEACENYKGSSTGSDDVKNGLPIVIDDDESDQSDVIDLSQAVDDLSCGHNASVEDQAMPRTEIDSIFDIVSPCKASSTDIISSQIQKVDKRPRVPLLVDSDEEDGGNHNEDESDSDDENLLRPLAERLNIICNRVAGVGNDREEAHISTSHLLLSSFSSARVERAPLAPLSSSEENLLETRMHVNKATTEGINGHTSQNSQEKRAQTEERRIEKQAQKAQERARRLAEREQQRALKKLRQEEQAALKKDERLRTQIAQGKFAHEEIAMLFESRFAASTYGKNVVTAFGNGVGPQNVKVLIDDGPDIRIALRLLASSQSKAEGGTSQPSSAPMYLLPFLVVFWRADRFLLIMNQHGFGFIDKCIQDLRAATNASARIVFLIEGFTNLVNSRGRQSGQLGSSQMVRQLEEFSIELYAKCKCDMKHCASFEEVVTYLGNITRFLAEEPYRAELKTLDVVVKSKSVRNGEDRDVDSSNSLSDAWLHQLEMIPGVSTAKAQFIMNRHSTAFSFLSKIDPSTTPRESAMAFLETAISNRRESVVAKRIMSVLTSKNPDEQIF